MDTLPSISLAISIVVIICMTIAFVILFLLYTFSKTRGIKGGAEDIDLLLNLEKDYDENVAHINRIDVNTGDNVEVKEMGYCDYLDSKKKQAKLPRILTDIIFAVIIAVIFAISVTACVFRANGEQFFMGDTAYLTIRTGSMAEKNVANPFYENIPDNQIEQYSLIGVSKVSADEIKLYDIIAFKADGVTYVHRVVGIFEVDGQKHFTTMGDANNSSMASEIDITFDSVMGKYNGYQSVGMGYFFIYLNSDIGIIALLFALLFVLTVDLAELQISKRTEERIYKIARWLDENPYENPYKGQPTEKNIAEPVPVEETVEEAVCEPVTEEPVEVIEPSDIEDKVEPVEQEQIEVIEPIMGDDFDEGPVIEGYNVVRYDRSFTSRLIKSNDTVKGWYSELKNELLSYPKVRASMSWRYESFMLGRKRVARFAIRGTTLCVYLALSPEKYAETKYKVEDVSEQTTLGDLKCLYRIKNDRRVKYTKDLIAEIMTEFGVTKKSTPSAEDWYLPYNGDAVLLEKGLIKRKIVKVLSEDSGFWANSRPVEEKSPDEEISNDEQNQDVNGAVLEEQDVNDENSALKEYAKTVAHDINLSYGVSIDSEQNVASDSVNDSSEGEPNA